MIRKVSYESQERREKQVLAALNANGIQSLEEANQICEDAGVDPYQMCEDTQRICFENAKWAYVAGAAIAIKKGVKTAADAAEAIGIGLQAFCIPGSVADDRKVGLGHGNLAARLLREETQCFAFLAGHESFAAAEGAIKIVVTTTRGAADRFNVSYKGIVSTILKPQLSKLNRASTSDYIDAELDLYYQNPNRPSTQSVSNMSKVTWLMMQAREGNMTEAEALAEIDKLRNINGLKQAEKYFYRNQLSHQHNIAINGGTEKNRFNAAVNYMYNRGNMIHSDNSRLIFDLKND